MPHKARPFTGAYGQIGRVKAVELHRARWIMPAVIPRLPDLGICAMPPEEDQLGRGDWCAPGYWPADPLRGGSRILNPKFWPEYQLNFTATVVLRGDDDHNFKLYQRREIDELENRVRKDEVDVLLGPFRPHLYLLAFGNHDLESPLVLGWHVLCWSAICTFLPVAEVRTLFSPPIHGWIKDEATGTGMWHHTWFRELRLERLYELCQEHGVDTDRIFFAASSEYDTPELRERVKFATCIETPARWEQGILNT